MKSSRSVAVLLATFVVVGLAVVPAAAIGSDGDHPVAEFTDDGDDASTLQSANDGDAGDDDGDAADHDDRNATDDADESNESDDGGLPLVQSTDDADDGLSLVQSTDDGGLPLVQSTDADDGDGPFPEEICTDLLELVHEDAPYDQVVWVDELPEDVQPPGVPWTVMTPGAVGSIVVAMAPNQCDIQDPNDPSWDPREDDLDPDADFDFRQGADDEVLFVLNGTLDRSGEGPGVETASDLLIDENGHVDLDVRFNDGEKDYALSPELQYWEDGSSYFGTDVFVYGSRAGIELDCTGEECEIGTPGLPQYVDYPTLPAPGDGGADDADEETGPEPEETDDSGDGPETDDSGTSDSGTSETDDDGQGSDDRQQTDDVDQEVSAGDGPQTPTVQDTREGEDDDAGTSFAGILATVVTLLLSAGVVARADQM